MPKAFYKGVTLEKRKPTTGTPLMSANNPPPHMQKWPGEVMGFQLAHLLGGQIVPFMNNKVTLAKENYPVAHKSEWQKFTTKYFCDLFLKSTLQKPKSPKNKSEIKIMKTFLKVTFPKLFIYPNFCISSNKYLIYRKMSTLSKKKNWLIINWLLVKILKLSKK